eukprot:419261_1
MASSNSIPVLTYRWEYKESDWIPLSYDECQQIESNLIIQQQTKTILNPQLEAHKHFNGYKLLKEKSKIRELRRTDTFTGKILGINKHYSRGFVESNFPNSQNKGIRFFFSDVCQFNAMYLNKGDTVIYQIKYDQKKSEFAAYNVKVSNSNPQKRLPNKQDTIHKNQFHSKSHINNMANQYNNNRHYKPFHQHKMKDVPKPLWHPQYMCIILNGYFTKYHNNGGTIQRQKGSKCNEKESDEISFYFKHCTKTFLQSYEQRHRQSQSVFVKFKIGYIPGNRNKLLAYDIDFDYEKPKRELKIRGEITHLPKRDHIKNKNGWIYCEEENWCYPFDNINNIHYNIGNIVYFNTYIQNGINWANNIEISKKYNQSIWKLIYNEQSKVIYNNNLSDKGKPLYIQNASINLTEDLFTEFKQFKDLNGYCNVIKIGEVMLKYLNAFVNTQGGSIYFGIDDNGIVRGEEFVDEEVQDNIQKYIDNRLRQWTPKLDGKMIIIDFIQVIRRMDDNNCYLLPDVMVIRASVHAIKLQNSVRFKNHDNKSWTKNLASVARVHSDRNLFGYNNNVRDDYKNNNENKDNEDMKEPGVDDIGGLQLDVSVDIDDDTAKIQQQLKVITGMDVEEGIISDVYNSQNGNSKKDIMEKTLQYLCLLFAPEQN